MKILSFVRWRLFLGVLSLIWVLLLVAIQLAGMRNTYVLPPSTIQHETGFAYIAILKQRPWGWPITAYANDNPSAPQASGLILFENGRSSGHPHTLHDDIRNHGMGDYSHWSYYLIFSASDNGDPRINGRIYTVGMPVTLSAFGDATAFLASIIFLWLIQSSPWGRRRSDEFPVFVRKILATLLSPWDLTRPTGIGIGLFVLSVVFAAWILVSGWSSARSADDAVAGYFQFSDANGYWFCANSLLDTGKLGAWCTRRPIYTSFLSGIELFTGRDIFGTLLLQAGLICAALFVFVRRGAAQIGIAAAAVCMALLLAYDTNNLMKFTMTENAGLAFGCIGFALLLKAAENWSLSWMIAGMAVVSVALNARAGAFFVLPCLVLWAAITAHLSHQNIWRWMVAAGVAGLAGFALTAILVVVAGAHSGFAFGNFSYTLYGLTVGGKGWGQTLVDHPELLGHTDGYMSKAAYVLAWKSFLAHPQLFLQGLGKNVSLFLISGTFGYEILGPWALYAKILWWFGWIPLLLKFRNPSYLLVALSSLGVVASAPLLLMDGGPRVFAATAAIDALQIGIGLHFAGGLCLRAMDVLFGKLPEKTPALTPRSGWIQSHLETLVGTVLLAMVVVPYTPLHYVTVQKPVTPDACRAGEDSMVAHIGRGGSLLLDMMAATNQTGFLRGTVGREQLIEGIPAYTWWGDDVAAFGEGSLLWAYDLDAHDPFNWIPYGVFSAEHLSVYWGHTVRLCLDTTGEKNILNISFRKTDSVTLLD